jgi:hypothetical protein
VRGRVNLTERGVDAALPVVIAILATALATLNLAGNGVGRTLTWVFQPIVLVAGGVVSAGQVFAGRYVRSAFVRTGDEELAGIDVGELMDAAVRAFPSWFRIVVIARFALVTLGSVVIIILLTLPSATHYFDYA